MPGSQQQQVEVLIDGFNLYNGVKDQSGRKDLWLDVEALASALLQPGQELSRVRYFSAWVRNAPASLQRQQAYVNALGASTSVEVVMGRFQEKKVVCYNCRKQRTSYEEKETDVHLGVCLVEIAALKTASVVLLMSADSDFCPAVEVAKRLDPQLRIVNVSPPRRHSVGLEKACHGHVQLGQNLVRGAQLPSAVPGKRGKTFDRPLYWS